MADETTSEWTWNMTDVDNMTVAEIKAALENRGEKNKKGRKRELLSRLKTKYQVNDCKLASFVSMSKERLFAEAMLRKLIPRKKDYYLSTYEFLWELKRDTLRRMKTKPNSYTPCDALVVYGYVREALPPLLFSYFPQYLQDLIAKFSRMRMLAMCRANNELFIADFNNVRSRKWRARIVGIAGASKSRANRFCSFSWDDISNLVTAQSVALPSTIKDAITSQKQYDLDDFSVTFAAYGNHYVQATLLNQSECISNSTEEPMAFEWKLPIPSSTPVYGHTLQLCFDASYGLFSHSFPSPCLQLLSFTSHDFMQQSKQWKWQQLTSIEHGSFSSSVVIETSDHKKKVFIIGQHSFAELYDMQNRTLSRTKALKRATNHAGICYDSVTQSVFVGGGIDDTKSKAWQPFTVQLFDLEQEACSVLPPTWMSHAVHPTLWTDVCNPMLLYIGSMTQDGVERLDLRMSERKWNPVCVPAPGRALSNKLGLGIFAANITRDHFRTRYPMWSVVKMQT